MTTRKARRSGPLINFTARFPREVYEPIWADAQRNDRTIAAEVIHRLKKTIPAPTKAPAKRRTLEAAE